MTIYKSISTSIFISIIILLIIKLYYDHSLICNYEIQIKKLTPKFTSKDTVQLLNAILNLKEFDWNTKLLDTSVPVTIFQYPFITNIYNLRKFNKEVEFLDEIDIPSKNGFVFHYFSLTSDSANFLFRFNYSHVGMVKAKKRNNDWKIVEYWFGQK